MGQGVVVWTLLEGTLFAEDLRGQSQQEELRGDGEKVKVVLILSLLLFFINLWKCLRRAGGRKYSQ